MSETGPTGTVESITSVESLALDDILQEHDVIAEKEAADRLALQNVGKMKPDELRPAFIAWAKAGCPDAHPIFSVSVQPPAICSDGVVRDSFAYAEYLLGMPVYCVMSELQYKLNGMTLSYSTLPDKLTFHVTKKTN